MDKCFAAGQYDLSSSGRQAKAKYLQYYHALYELSVNWCSSCTEMVNFMKVFFWYTEGERYLQLSMDL